MQVRNFKDFLLITFYILTFSQMVEAQKIEQNQEGEKIVLFPDGEWEYFDKTNPYHISIENENENEKAKIASPIAILDEYTSKGGDDDIERYENLLDEAEDKLALAEEKESDVKFSKILLEEAMEELKDDENSTDKQYDELKHQLKLASALEKDAKKKTKKAKKELDKLKKQGGIVQKVPQKRKSRKNKNREIELKKSESPDQEDGTFFFASKKFKKYSKQEDVIFNPPQQDCNLAFDGIDEFMGKKRKDVARDIFFTYTDDNMRRYMKEDDYILCEGNLTQIKGGVLLLNLFISINTTDAQRSFGGLAKGNMLTLKMINGESVNLVNNQSDNGVYDPLKKRHTYVGQFRINAGQEKALRKGELDVVRVIWGTGYEDYEVYNLDFFINQFKCLNK